MFAATKVPGEMSTRVSPCAAPSDSNPMDKIANDAFRQFFSTDVRGKTPLGFAAFFMDCALLPPERRSHRLWLVGEVCCVFAGLMLFFASTVPDIEATSTLGIVATCVGSFAVLALVVACLFSAAPVMMCTTPDLTTTFAACKMLGWANFFLLNGAIMALSATRREIALQGDAVFMKTSTRCHVASTPSMQQHESQRVSFHAAPRSCWTRWPGRTAGSSGGSAWA